MWAVLKRSVINSCKLSSNRLCDNNRTLNKSGIVNNKGWFALATESDRSHNRKRKTLNDLVKTAFWFRLRLRHLRSSENYIVGVASRSRGTKPESQNLGTCIVIGLSYRICFRFRQSYSYSGYQRFFSCVRRGASSAAGRRNGRQSRGKKKPCFSRGSLFKN